MVWVAIAYGEQGDVCAVVSISKRLDYLQWSGVDTFCDDRNLAYIFHLGATGTPPSKTLRKACRGGMLVSASSGFSLVHTSRGSRTAGVTCCRGGFGSQTVFSVF